MRVLIASTAYWPFPSGVSEHVYYLAKYLDKKGHSVTILTTNYPQQHDDQYDRNFKIIRIGKAVAIPINKSISHIVLGMDIVGKIRTLLKNEHFDVIHYHNCFPMELEFWVIHFSQTINCVTFHTIGFKRYPVYKIASKLLKKYIQKIHGRIAVSRIALEWNRPYFPGDYTIIPNGIDTERFSLTVEPFEKPNGAFVILYLGRLNQRKGIFVALDAFRKIKEDYPNALLNIVGTGPLEVAAKTYAEKLKLINHCRFFGYVSRAHLPRFYRTCDVFIAPALGGESQGIVLLEAMACGKPVIASNITGYQEVIQNYENGILFNTGSSQDLADKIKLLIEDRKLREKIEINARRDAEQYAWPKIIERVENYYVELITRYRISASVSDY